MDENWHRLLEAPLCTYEKEGVIVIIGFLGLTVVCWKVLSASLWR